MRIAQVELFVVGDSWRNLIFPRLRTDDGIHGCSEATLHNKTAAVLAYLDEIKDRYVLAKGAGATCTEVRVLIQVNQGMPYDRTE
jgi:hypothetical protein